MYVCVCDVCMCECMCACVSINIAMSNYEEVLLLTAATRSDSASRNPAGRHPRAAPRGHHRGQTPKPAVGHQAPSCPASTPASTVPPQRLAALFRLRPAKAARRAMPPRLAALNSNVWPLHAAPLSLSPLPSWHASFHGTNGQTVRNRASVIHSLAGDHVERKALRLVRACPSLEAACRWAHAKRLRTAARSAQPSPPAALATTCRGPPGIRTNCSAIFLFYYSTPHRARQSPPYWAVRSAGASARVGSPRGRLMAARASCVVAMVPRLKAARAIAREPVAAPRPDLGLEHEGLHQVRFEA